MFDAGRFAADGFAVDLSDLWVAMVRAPSAWDNRLGTH